MSRPALKQTVFYNSHCFISNRSTSLFGEVQLNSTKFCFIKIAFTFAKMIYYTQPGIMLSISLKTLKKKLQLISNRIKKIFDNNKVLYRFIIPGAK